MLSYTVDGPLNIYTVNDHNQKVSVWLDSGQDHELDLANVNEIDATGVQWLLWLEREHQQCQHHLVLRSPNQSVKNALQQTGCHQLLTTAIYE